MKVRVKIILIVLPLIMTTLFIAGFMSSLSAENAITRIAVDFLGFKAKELKKYSQNQWDLLVANNFTQNEKYLEATQKAISSYSNTLISGSGEDAKTTELIFAVKEGGGIAFSTGTQVISKSDQDQIQKLYNSNKEGWFTFKLGNESRVAQGFMFVPFNWYVVVSEAENTFYMAVREILTLNGLILAISAIFAVFLLLMFVGFIMEPLGRVVYSMQEIITHNDFSQRVKVEFRDEIGNLAGTFNIMIQELDKAYNQIKNFAFQTVLAEKREKKIRNIFQKYVPKDVIEKIFTNPESMLVGDNRKMVILFSDIRSFTTISESLPPDELVNSLNRYFSIMVDIIVHHGGIVDKYIGDAIMAFYGAPVKGPNDPLASVETALDMSDALLEFNKKQIELGHPEFFTGIGLNYGEVTVGNIGSEKKMDYTVIGDGVNLASRLEGLTKKYGQQLIFSESIYRKIYKHLPCRFIDKVVVKGKTTGENIYTAKKKLRGEEDRLWNNHHAGIQFYYNRDFGNALKYFRRNLTNMPDDKLSEIYISRSEEYLKNPPPANWIGLEILKEK